VHAGSDDAPEVVRFRHWILDVTLAWDPVWVPIQLNPDGTVRAIWNGFAYQGLLPPPTGEAYGMWHPDGQAALERWYHSEAGREWNAKFKAASSASPVDETTTTDTVSTPNLTASTSDTPSPE
jgi:hypothetical protein